jgi:hypothetical protein
MLVPLSIAYSPLRYVDNIDTPAAAIVTDGPKLLKYAKVSSVEFYDLSAGPSPPSLPSLSAIAETVIALRLLAGEVVDASWP